MTFSSNSVSGAAVAWLLVGAAISASAAAKWTESFTGGANGWTGVVNGAASVTFAADQARMAFAAAGFPNPDTVTLVATNSSSGGAFIGNYRLAGAQLIGLDLLATQVVPSQVTITLAGAADSVSRSLGHLLPATGVWRHVELSLEGAEAGGWNESSPGCFEDVLADVRQVRLYVLRNGTLAQACLVDNFHLSDMPHAAACATEAGDVLRVTWSALHANQVYSVQAAAQAGGSWQEISTLVATSSVHTWSAPYPANASACIYRLWR